MFFNRKRRAIEQTLGTRVPSEANDLHYFRQKLYPNSDLNLETVYIKFRTSRQAYLDLMEQLGAEFHKNSATSWHYTWPDEWTGVNDLEWWDLSFDTTEDVAVTPPGTIRMRAKYEGGSAYIKSLR